jgi:hypothetical protein
MDPAVTLSLRYLPEYSPDANLCTLGTAEIFLVMSLRLWNTGETDSATNTPRWSAGFHSAAIDLAGMLAFDQLCRRIAIAAFRCTQVRTPSCRYVSRDEALVLQAIGQLQLTQTPQAAASLGELCPAAAVRFLLQPAHALAESLRGRGLSLPRRIPMSAFALGIRDASAAAPAGYVH